MKKCPGCELFKKFDDFNIDRKTKTGFACLCRLCINIKRRKIRKDNLLSIRAAEKIRTQKRKEWKKVYDKKRRLSNRFEFNKKHNEKYRNNIQFRLALNLRRRINKFIVREDRRGSAVRDLGCDLNFFKQYIESKFTEGMSWDNYGKWHLDHIYPLSLVDLSNRDEFLRVSHYTNYQPLWATDNIKKGNKIT